MNYVPISIAYDLVPGCYIFLEVEVQKHPEQQKTAAGSLQIDTAAHF